MSSLPELGPVGGHSRIGQIDTSDTVVCSATSRRVAHHLPSDVVGPVSTGRRESEKRERERGKGEREERERERRKREREKREREREWRER